ncbi:hypothetical protein GCM10009087_49240 [Sphingomonas oligophenolica]
MRKYPHTALLAYPTGKGPYRIRRGHVALRRVDPSATKAQFAGNVRCALYIDIDQQYPIVCREPAGDGCSHSACTDDQCRWFHIHSKSPVSRSGR